MPGARATSLLYLALCLGTFPIVLSTPHGDESGNMGGDGHMNMSGPVDIEWSDSFKVPNYFRHPDYTFWIWSHIILMIVSWMIILPLGKG
jgi:hypothetical protein